ncbi:leucine-rich repeat domain-containing protein [Otoolea muris]|uniref:leucine-rich repeat domain-containing protein n=1 Tax=Otoolea muris TaxID=2941515 RepID=UPI003A7F1830
MERAQNLVTLNLAGNQISNVDILKELKSLIKVDLTGNPIASGEPERSPEDPNYY